MRRFREASEAARHHQASMVDFSGTLLLPTQNCPTTMGNADRPSVHNVTLELIGFYRRGADEFFYWLPIC